MTSKAVLSSLSEPEWLLHSQTEPAVLRGLDEDGLIDLHTRVRRARTKFRDQYRRAASARVEAVGGRGKARPQKTRAADKAEVFEDALARVSSALARAARASAAQLRAERLAQARTPGRGGGSPARATDVALGDPGSAKDRAASTRTPIARKNVASHQAAGARKQAKRDSR